MDEDDWTTIPDDDVVWSGPTRLPPPLADPAPPLLNTNEMDWESFECLVLAMARSLDGGYDVRLYGRLGQAQHGLDVVAFFAERKPSVYQAKRWQGFGASDLAEAVDRYTEGRQPFGADRIIIAVATEARDTQTIEKLAELRERHKGMEIELWDRRAISDRLHLLRPGHRCGVLHQHPSATANRTSAATGVHRCRRDTPGPSRSPRSHRRSASR